MSLVKDCSVFVLAAICFFQNADSQYMNKESKRLKSQEVDQYIKENHGKLVENPYFKHCNFYECDPNT